ncbi:hypothetical protein BX616_003987 [Lobosporangium transversale]|uniref:Uncharacterized protein n=1 Tax=Lobosporangium transversale TaxID=64571 RepID=A0A1Y2GJ36_9FUNG|nr:hypothetical protein BCR41DRAFT_371750 [Lobosporangium transversale]KAF9916355.1 hypothetical protein BX616_003987 [Lobosporangium transversale]ORZ12470.1 hypothetical protein BCR41DRAFT_371750 [Lobosporangium transversale]|eukprot:XP_021880089.1 hypothetical protein BCR41DRAFT_371750 [Lobosporangium transversale]
MSQDKGYYASQPPQYPQQVQPAYGQPAYGQAASYQPGYPPQSGYDQPGYPQSNTMGGYYAQPSPQPGMYQQQPPPPQNSKKDDICFGCTILSDPTLPINDPASLTSSPVIFLILIIPKRASQEKESFFLQVKANLLFRREKSPYLVTELTKWKGINAKGLYDLSYGIVLSKAFDLSLALALGTKEMRQFSVYTENE